MQLLEPHGKSFFGTKQVFHKPKIDFPWSINNARVLLDDEQRESKPTSRRDPIFQDPPSRCLIQNEAVAPAGRRIDSHNLTAIINPDGLGRGSGGHVGSNEDAPVEPETVLDPISEVVADDLTPIIDAARLGSGCARDIDRREGSFI